jgi:cytochrome c-type biogenesis protein CcmH
MLLWIGFAVLTAAVVALLMAPLQREQTTSGDAAAADLAVYRDQLAEIEAEQERGVVATDELAGARTEIARRLIRRADESSSKSAPTSGAQEPWRAQSVFYVIAGLIPVLSIAVYLFVGTPQLPARPFAAQQGAPVEQASVTDLIGRVEERLREHPEDGKGWEVIAPVYLRLERFGDAARAYAQANRILGESANRLSGFAEATLLANNGVMTEDVRKAAERLLALQPGSADARFWLALAKEQDGNLTGAIAAYQEIVSTAPPDADWRQTVEERIEQAKKRLAGGPETQKEAAKEGERAAPPSAAGPTADDVARVGAMNPDERARFITQMVEGLAARLKGDGNDLPGWLKLVRAYKVLGRDSDAVAALKDARQHFEKDQKSLAEIEQVAKSLGLGS